MPLSEIKGNRIVFLSNMIKMDTALYNVNVPKYDNLYAPYIHDMVRTLCIHLVMFMMYMMKDSSNVSLGMIVESILYIFLGVSFYWLVVRKIISID